MNRLAAIAATLALGAGSLALAGSARAEDKVDFGKQIVPILKENCFKCHGAEKQKAKLALHTPEAITKGSKEGPAIVKGDPTKSTLYTRVTLPAGHEDIMPPEDEGKPLKKEQTDLIAAWIKAGADFGDWKGDGAGSAAAAPKEIPLPVVPAADQGGVDKLKSTGALVLPLAQGINLLDVSFISGADKITDAELANLAAVGDQIFALNLAGTKVTDAGLAAIAKLPNVRILHLEKTAVGDAGLAHLKGLSHLEYLNLYGTQVTDAGLSQLEGLKNLKNVYLWQSKVTDDGAGKLRTALPTAKVDNGWKEPVVASAASAEKPGDKAAEKPAEKK
jgi:mono/diheme cytochrome c family protein